MAEYIAASEGFDAKSAGLCAYNGMKASTNAITAMKEIGIDISEHKSRLLTKEIVSWADFIFTMTESHLLGLLERFPEAAGKTKTLKKNGDIADPFGGDLGIYRRCRDEILHCLKSNA